MNTMTAALAASLCIALSIGPAEAARRKPSQPASAPRQECLTDEGGPSIGCAGGRPAPTAVAARGRPARAASNVSRETSPGPGGRNSTSLAGITPPLAAKAREIVADCGSKVVSSIRRGARVYGGNASNHASGRAIDLQGNPACIYAHLQDWPGGVSTDYSRAPGGAHVHVSHNPGGMEWGMRFKHHR